VRSTGTSTQRIREPFFTVWPLVAVSLFALNNLWLKSAFPGVVSGKLSDVTACFFLPLYIAALLAFAPSLRLGVRVWCGMAITGLVFTAVKTNPGASAVLDHAIELLTSWASLRLEANRVDPTDLWALIMIPLAWLYATGRELQTARATS
jgi:hypothetical protein